MKIYDIKPRWLRRTTTAITFLAYALVVVLFSIVDGLCIGVRTAAGYISEMFNDAKQAWQ